MARPIEPLLTVADLDCMPDDGNRYEVIEGVIQVSRAPGLTHQRVLGKLLTSFALYFIQNPVGEILATPGVILSDFNGVIPDLVFISHELRDEIALGERITGAPEIVIEIVSPGADNERRDRRTQRQGAGRTVGLQRPRDPQRRARRAQGGPGADRGVRRG